jgi:predicted aspartyl protease
MKLRAVLAASLICGHCAAAIVIPIEIEGGNPVANVRINGVDARLIIDSGGDLVSLASAFIDRVAATRTGKNADGTNALGQTAAQALLELNSLEIGGKTFRNVPAQESGAYAADSAGDGVIGRRFLEAFIAVYDYPAHRISLFEPRERDAVERQCRGTRLQVLPDPEGLIITRARADQHEMRVLWDTGAVQSFVKKSFADAQRLPVETPFYRARQFELDGHDVGPLRFVVTDLRAPASVDGYLGYNFFADHVVCMDPRGRVVRLRNP